MHQLRYSRRYVPEYKNIRNDTGILFLLLSTLNVSTLNTEHSRTRTVRKKTQSRVGQVKAWSIVTSSKFGDFLNYGGPMESKQMPRKLLGSSQAKLYLC